MKNAILILAIVAIGYFAYSYLHARHVSAAPTTDIEFETPPIKHPINVVYFQDGSGSISQNGVELINSSVFLPYCNDIHRDIQLSFGVISEQTSKKLIPVELLAERLKKPIMPIWDNVPFIAQNELKKKFTESMQIYQRDSAEYFSDRIKRFSAFCSQVDSVLAPYKVKLSQSTDLVTVIGIADKAFNYCFAGKSTNYLLINSDGFDSQNRLPEKLTNKSEVILINANGNTTTSLDAVITRSLQSTEQAIEFTLNTHNLNN